MSSANRPPRLLVLFQGAWEDEALFRRVRQGELLLEREGFEFLDRRHLPRLVHFDARRYVDRLHATYRGRIDGVWSNDDGFGCLCAALLAARLGLPGHDPRAIVRAQHKLLLRRALAASMPGENVSAMALPFAFGDRRGRSPAALDAVLAAAGQRWPRFAKPVKGAFSALARRVASADELAAHLRLPFRDRFVLRGVARPFEQLAADILPLPCSVDRLLLEDPLVGAQVNVDGYVANGEPHLLGLVDEWMYAGEVQGARHFAGFTYPSRHPAAAQERMRRAAVAAVRAVGLTHGLFNVELFLLADGSVRVIEVNARGAGQFATLYRDVDGIDLEGIAIALATGQDPLAVPRSEPVAGAAGSFVFRRFDGGPGPEPDPAVLRWLASAHPKARLWCESAEGSALRREYRWFGSHRFAVLNASAPDFEALQAQGEACGRQLFGAALQLGAH
jgi:hypothetical protein